MTCEVWVKGMGSSCVKVPSMEFSHWGHALLCEWKTDIGQDSEVTAKPNLVYARLSFLEGEWDKSLLESLLEDFSAFIVNNEACIWVTELAYREFSVHFPPSVDIFFLSTHAVHGHNCHNGCPPPPFKNELSSCMRCSTMSTQKVYLSAKGDSSPHSSPDNLDPKNGFNFLLLASKRQKA